MNNSDTPAGTEIRPVVLCILDGWGHSDETANNAIAQANTPVWDQLTATAPHALLDASEHHVGLPAGQMGNSEVGHMNIGAGRIVLQDLPRIDHAVENRTLGTLPPFKGFADKLKQSGGKVHLMGLLSPGGVHSHQKHFAAVAGLLSDLGIPVVIHAFLDGRDTPPESAIGYLQTFQNDIAGKKNISFGTVIGRYYAMDRDKRWDRVEAAYKALAIGDGTSSATPLDAITNAYDADLTDEFVTPSVVEGYAGMAEGDGLLMVNYRADRVREILGAFLDPAFDGFERSGTHVFAAALGMSNYSTHLDGFMDTLFPSAMPANVLGQVVADAGLKQLRIAETEKYAHVTFFLNGGLESEFPGEDRILVPSPRVATYDLQPEMSAPELTKQLVAAIENGGYSLIVVNYANTDMVGHTGNLAAAIKAVETVDTCLGKLDQAVRSVGGALLVTADHGNAERMVDPNTGGIHTAHTNNLVPLVVSFKGGTDWHVVDGKLADLAPTALRLMGLEPPEEMTGNMLITLNVDTQEKRRVAAG